MLSVSNVPRVSRRRGPDRCGAIAVFAAFLLIVLFACTAFCVDIGWTTLTKSELQNAADAAAAAGAAQLTDNYSAYSIPLQSKQSELISSARQAANRYSGTYGEYNGAGGVSALTILPQDIQIGFTDADGN